LFLFSCRKEVKEEIPAQKQAPKQTVKFRTYVIYYTDQELVKISPGTITLEEKEGELENIKYLLSTYFSLKKENLFPEGISLRALYPFEDSIVVDINIPESSMPLQSIKEELLFVEAITKTLCLNFQKYKSVNILINGSQENKFINHIALYVNYKP
ncbi:MAG: GerMN domain-containing protein, partial [Thermoanaerobaculia bacterium]